MCPERTAEAAITLPFPQPIGIVLVPRFTLIALASTVEPLRIANRYAEHPYDWRLYSVDGEAVPDRNGVPIAVKGALAEAEPLGTVIVIADVGPPRAMADALSRELRRRAHAGAVIGGVDTAPLLLARAGLLDGHRATAHWEVLPAFRERYP
ncbi:MAG TPA: AraC family transcriptional regulator, partial [Acetobacteraceae bacterium]|nr:AraC family transcriptional regulator [Acetobacteraceae bacterium]